MQSPCRALSFENEDPTPDKGNLQQRPSSSSLCQSRLIRKAVKPLPCRGRREREAVALRQTQQHTKETQRTLRFGNQELTQRDCEISRVGNPRDQGEEEGISERQEDPSPNAPAMCVPVSASIVHAAIQNKIVDSSRAKHSDRAQVLRRARSPPRLHLHFLHFPTASWVERTTKARLFVTPLQTRSS